MGKDRHPPSDVEFIITRGVSHVHQLLTREKLQKPWRLMRKIGCGFQVESAVASRGS